VLYKGKGWEIRTSELFITGELAFSLIKNVSGGRDVVGEEEKVS
jgi:hypothetical protein